jgi:peptidoglycan hydrolase-like protein with peptidoglycan-binding domain
MTTTTSTVKNRSTRSRRLLRTAAIGIAGLAAATASVTVGVGAAGAATPAHHAHHSVWLASESTVTWVKTLQQELTTLGVYGGPIDGIYGPQTRAAVESIQRDASIHPTGTMNAGTATALQRFLAEHTSSGAHGTTSGSTATVTTLQEELGRLNFYEGPIDGIYGPQTTQAVDNLQRAAGLAQTGVVNPTTQAAIQNFLANGDSVMNQGSATTLLYATK